ncbi:hypothetical protein ColLi_12723 [Colletotrichum liriopes]|uniref:Uncharacterized protein n=1 Tax=Colletotrichum liriopes TaxID=708192 RepID=A0AA37GYW8_9PEZI|nr:hypothetical protein ColLi_12723 [Colletotrichum liriopes]
MSERHDLRSSCKKGNSLRPAPSRRRKTSNTKEQHEFAGRIPEHPLPDPVPQISHFQPKLGDHKPDAKMMPVSKAEPTARKKVEKPLLERYI